MNAISKAKRKRGAKQQSAKQPKNEEKAMIRMVERESPLLLDGLGGGLRDGEQDVPDKETSPAQYKQADEEMSKN